MKSRISCRWGYLVCLFASCSFALEPCQIQVVEKGSGWPVPLIELRTTSGVRFVTDNAGLIAFDLPESLGKETWFDVVGHGYEVPRDGFGSVGVRLTPTPGQTLRVEVLRTQIAKRLGRLTGSGIFAESQKLGLERDWAESGVAGCDSVQIAAHRGKLYWAWGDTIVPFYKLGIFEMTSATTPLQPLQSFAPPLHLHFDYFLSDEARPRAVAKMPGSGPTWVNGLVSLPDKDGSSRLVGSYIKVRNHLDAYQSGLCVWDEKSANFQPLRVIWTKSEAAPMAPPLPDGHPSLWKDGAGKQWVLFGNPLPKLRCPANFEAWQEPGQWEVIAAQSTLVATSDGHAVKPHTGSISWNSWRNCWVTVFMEAYGEPSAFGELWYAEADQPTGPWGRAIKILSHNNYTFYNPCLHPELTPADSPILLFEGTYTAEFANHAEPTPRYNYNQILYRLDLDDPALAPARQRQP